MSTILAEVTETVVTAGQMLADEFCRAEGPRFSDTVTAPVDREIELYLRTRLTTLLPARFVGEEIGVWEAPSNGFCWVVDPHDGTRAFLEGRRGSAVSVALLRDGEPVLGVVLAPSSPDRGSDLIAWAEGAPLTRNGQLVRHDLSGRDLRMDEVVFLNHGSWQRPVWNGRAVAPGRFMPLPSIAYRLARVAAGDGVAAVTLRPVSALDIAAGHALLTAAGGVLIAEDGAPVTYSALGESRPSACFGGAPKAVETLRRRTWRGSSEPRQPQLIALGWPREPEGLALDRAIGAMVGLFIGESRDAVQQGRMSGQPGETGEAVLAFARALAMGTEPSPCSGPSCVVPLAIAAIDPARAAAAEAEKVGANSLAWANLAAAIAGGLAGAGEDEVIRLAGGRPLDRPLAEALRGASLGRSAFPPQEVLAVLTCRPDAGLGVRHPRPFALWPNDLLDLAEALLLSRRP